MVYNRPLVANLGRLVWECPPALVANLEVSVWEHPLLANLDRLA